LQKHKELREELERRKEKGDGRDDFENIEEILTTLEQNAEKINHHGQRTGYCHDFSNAARGIERSLASGSMTSINCFSNSAAITA
jgi:hypothetical protein